MRYALIFTLSTIMATTVGSAASEIINQGFQSIGETLESVMSAP